MFTRFMSKYLKPCDFYFASFWHQVRRALLSLCPSWNRWFFFINLLLCGSWYSSKTFSLFSYGSCWLNLHVCSVFYLKCRSEKSWNHLSVLCSVPYPPSASIWSSSNKRKYLMSGRSVGSSQHALHQTTLEKWSWLFPPPRPPSFLQAIIR